MENKTIYLKSNEKALEILGQQYKGFIDLQDKWDFFRGLADYTKTLQEMDVARPLIEAMESQQKTSQKLIEQMSNSASTELAKTVKEMGEITKSLALDHKPFTGAMEKIKKQLDQSALAFQPLQKINNSLAEMARQLHDNGFSDAIKQFQGGNGGNGVSHHCLASLENAMSIQGDIF